MPPRIAVATCHDAMEEHQKNIKKRRRQTLSSSSSSSSSSSEEEEEEEENEDEEEEEDEDEDEDEEEEEEDPKTCSIFSELQNLKISFRSALFSHGEAERPPPHLLGALRPKTNVSVGVTHQDIAHEAIGLTSGSHLLDRVDLQHIILKTTEAATVI